MGLVASVENEMNRGQLLMYCWPVVLSHLSKWACVDAEEKERKDGSPMTLSPQEKGIEAE